MKIRSNFVANSSSSSSVFITTEEEHNRVLSLLTEFEKVVVNRFLEEDSLGDLKGYIIQECSEEDTSSYDDVGDFNHLIDLVIEKDKYDLNNGEYTGKRIVSKYKNLINKKLYFEQYR